MSIEAIGFAVPSIRQSAADVAAATAADPTFVSNKVGLAERYILGDEESGISLATSACTALLGQPGLAGLSPDLLVCITQNPDRRIPHNSPGIAAALGLPTTIASFDISLACSGYVYGVQIVEGFLQQCGMRHAILVTCDPYSRIMAQEDKDTNCIFGDAATATWITAGGRRSRMLAVDFGTDGGGADAIQIPAGGAALPLVSLLAGTSAASYSRDELRLHMQGRAVFNFVLSRIPGSIEKCLHHAGLSLEDIDYFAFHQGSIFMLDSLARHAGIPQDKLLKNMQRYGNTVSSTIPLLLAELDQQNSLAGKTVMMSGFGVGLSWATAIVRFDF